MFRRRWIVIVEDNSRHFRVGVARTRGGRDRLIRRGQRYAAEHQLLRVAVRDVRSIPVVVRAAAPATRPMQREPWPGE